MQGFDVLLLIQDLHHAAESAYPGKNQPFGRQDVLSRLDNLDLLAQAFDTVDDAPDIAGTVIQKSYHLLSCLPPKECSNGVSYTTISIKTSPMR